MEQQMSENRYVLDMSCGNITQILLQFSVPLLIGNLFQQVYNVVDSIVVGRYLGSKALGAVGSVGMISLLFFSLCMGLSSGIGVIVSNCFGAKKKKNPYCYGICLLCSASGNDKRIWGKCNGCLSGTTPASIHRPLFCPPDIIFSMLPVLCGWSYPLNTIFAIHQVSSFFFI